MSNQGVNWTLSKAVLDAMTPTEARRKLCGWVKGHDDTIDDQVLP
jgi:hypothetical protein